MSKMRFDRNYSPTLDRIVAKSRGGFNRRFPRNYMATPRMNYKSGSGWYSAINSFYAKEREEQRKTIAKFREDVKRSRRYRG